MHETGCQAGLGALNFRVLKGFFDAVSSVVVHNLVVFAFDFDALTSDIAPSLIRPGFLADIKEHLYLINSCRRSITHLKKQPSTDRLPTAPFFGLKTGDCVVWHADTAVCFIQAGEEPAKSDLIPRDGFESRMVMYPASHAILSRKSLFFMCCREQTP